MADPNEKTVKESEVSSAASFACAVVREELPSIPNPVFDKLDEAFEAQLARVLREAGYAIQNDE